jgi:carbonic anhydrase
LKRWLGFSRGPVQATLPALEYPETLSEEDRLSQRNVLQQVENLKTYPKIRERYQAGKLRIHAWWFDIAQAGVHAFDDRIRRFVLIDDKVGKELLAKLQTSGRQTQARPLGDSPRP